MAPVSPGATLASWHGSHEAAVSKQKLKSFLIPAMELAFVHVAMVKASHKTRPDLRRGKTDSTSAKEHGSMVIFF